MSQPVILVTGANGQLGKEIQALSAAWPRFHFIFLTKENLPIQDAAEVRACFEKTNPAFCINCAAYTAVDKAETDRETAMLINGEATGILAEACKSFNTKFIHVSTDYVFDGTSKNPYKEDDKTNPVNYYGLTKLKGEERCVEANSESIIIRTSWVYSEYGNNFVKTMIRLMKERDNLNVVGDQFGSPTYAADLAKAILEIISGKVSGKGEWVSGIYHYANEGVISWYDFAVAIKTLTGSSCIVNAIPTSAYPTPAKRPAYSVMQREKIKSVYHIVIPCWEDSLSVCINRLQR